MSGLVVPVAGVRAILDGSKTTHRVPARGVDRCYHPGRTYALQALRAREVALRAGGTTRRRQAGPAVARVRITSVELQALEDMTDADARAEGFPGVEAFLDAWQERYGDPPSRVAREECWVLSLEVLTSEGAPRLLAPLGHAPPRRAGPDGETTDADVGYTTNPARALRDEPEAVGRGEEDLYAEGSRRVWDVITAEDRMHEQARSLARRVREDVLQARRLGVSVDAEVEQIERALQELQRKRAA